MRRMLEVAVGVALTRLLGRRARRAPARGVRPARRPAAAGSGRGARPVAPARPSAPRGRPRGALVPVTLGALAVGAVLMLLFEVWYTRLVGVLALFTFVVAGVFLITGSGLLDPDEDG